MGRTIRRPTEEKALASVRRWERDNQTWKDREIMRNWKIVRESTDVSLVTKAKAFLKIED